MKSFILVGETPAERQARRHKTISYWKSFIRLVGYGILPFSLRAAAIILIVSEVLGVAEEVFGA